MEGSGVAPSFFVCIRLIRPIRVRFTSERNYHNYHNYPRNTILSFYLTQISQIPQIFYSHAETQSPRRELAFIIRMRVIRVRFTSERNYHNYHNYPRNTILSFYLTQISQFPQISFPFLFRYFSVSSVIKNIFAPITMRIKFDYCLPPPRTPIRTSINFIYPQRLA